MNYTPKQLKLQVYVGVLQVLIGLLDHYERVILDLYLLVRKLEKPLYWLAKLLIWRPRFRKLRDQLYGLTMKNKEAKLCSGAIKRPWVLDLSNSSATSKATTKNSSKQMEVG